MGRLSQERCEPWLSGRCVKWRLPVTLGNAVTTRPTLLRIDLYSPPQQMLPQFVKGADVMDGPGIFGLGG